MTNDTLYVISSFYKACSKSLLYLVLIKTYVRWAREVFSFQFYKWGNRVSFLRLQRPRLTLRSIDTHPHVFSFKWINKNALHLYRTLKFKSTFIYMRQIKWTEYFSTVCKMKLDLFRFWVRTIIQKSGDE